MARFWLIAFLLIAFGSAAAAPGAQVRVPSDMAASHLKSSPAPQYPPAAQTARIQGNVILHISIDPLGNVTPLRVVRGHPMLVPAAIAAVNNWKYTPFVLNGQPVLSNVAFAGTPPRGPLTLQSTGKKVEWANLLLREVD